MYKVPYIEDSVFKTEDVAKTIPEDLRTTKWTNYVEPGANYAANKWGIYGLLDEFDDCYIGLKSAYETYDFWKQLPYNGHEGLLHYADLDQKVF